jgi:hypothetical protein
MPDILINMQQRKIEELIEALDFLIETCGDIPKHTLEEAGLIDEDGNKVYKEMEWT